MIKLAYCFSHITFINADRAKAIAAAITNAAIPVSAVCGVVTGCVICDTESVYVVPSVFEVVLSLAASLIFVLSLAFSVITVEYVEMLP